MHRLPSLIFALLLLPSISSAAVLYIDPSQGTYGPGDTFALTIRLNPEGECINAAEVALLYPTKSLRAVDFSRGSSIFSLWVEEPKINVDTGAVTFAGGVPGGYCGRIQGDPSITNVLGKVIFTVTSSVEKNATVSIGASSKVYANDGFGTVITPVVHSASITLADKPQNTEDPWLKEVAADTVPPEAFAVQVESIPSIFGAKYYLIFTTIDKQSGLDHFEILERGAWKQIVSPYELRNQSIHSNIQIRAVDKAGNVRGGDYSEAIVQGQSQNGGRLNVLFLVIGVLLLVAFIRAYKNRIFAEKADGLGA